MSQFLIEERPVFDSELVDWDSLTPKCNCTKEKCHFDARHVVKRNELCCIPAGELYYSCGKCYKKRGSCAKCGHDPATWKVIADL